MKWFTLVLMIVVSLSIIPSSSEQQESPASIKEMPIGLLRQLILNTPEKFYWKSLNDTDNKESPESSGSSSSSSQSAQGDDEGMDGETVKKLFGNKTQIVPLEDLSPTALETLQKLELPADGAIHLIPIKDLDPNMPQGKLIWFLPLVFQVAVRMATIGAQVGLQALARGSVIAIRGVTYIGDAIKTGVNLAKPFIKQQLKGTMKEVKDHLKDYVKDYVEDYVEEAMYNIIDNNAPEAPQWDNSYDNQFHPVWLMMQGM